MEEANRPEIEPNQVEVSHLDNLSLEDLESAATTIDEWMAQIAQASTVQITNVQLDEMAEGVELILEASGELGSPEQSVTGNAVIADIPNAVLVLPDSDEFFASEPVEGVALINITNLPDSRVRIVITGIDAPPTVEISAGATSLMLGVTPGVATVEMPDDDSIQIVVTGEQDSYLTPNATTATRTDTPLRDIPQSIQVIPRQVLEDQQVIRVEEALNNVSGVTFGGAFAGIDVDFNIRGFEAPILRDGFRRFSGFEESPETANLEQIEVLKGPASILYGEIEPGGIINLVTKQPLSEPFYEAELQIGNRGAARPRIDFSGPLASDGRVSYRLNALASNENSFRGYEQDDQRFFFSPVLSWQVSDRTNLTLQVEYAKREGAADIGLPALGDSVVDVPDDRVLGEPDDFVDSIFVNLGYTLEHQLDENWRLRNAFRFLDRELLDVVSVPLFFDESTGFVGRGLSRQDLDTQEYSLQTNVVGEFATGSVDHTLLVGVDLSRIEEQEATGFAANENDIGFIDIFDPVYGTFAGLDSNNLPSFADNDTRVNRLGVYLQDQIDILDNLILVAGLRYDLVDRRTVNEATDFNPVRSKVNQDDDELSPRVGIVYQPIPEISLFGSYSQSFTPNLDTTSSGEPLEPETGEGFEAGIKAELLDGALFATLSYFDITRKNVSTPDPDDIFSVVATGEQKSRGVELDITGQILPGWNIIASYAYIDAEVTEDTVIPEGNRLFNTPEHSASLWTTYRIQQGNLRGLGFGIGFNFVDDREGDLENSFELDSYFLTNAAVSYQRDNWRLALNFNNLFDVDYIASSQNSRLFQNEPGAPFTVRGSISIEF